MIVDKNTHPERDLYYLGGKLIEILDASNQSEIDSIELYVIIKSKIDISFNLFALSLDWLFLLGVIRKVERGVLKRCF